MNKYTEEFLNLVKENPELPILPMVYSEVVADNDCAYWGGKFWFSEIKKVWLGTERWHFYDEDDIEEQIEALEDVDWYRTSSVDYYELEDTQIKQEYDELPWKETIVVYIDLPD